MPSLLETFDIFDHFRRTGHANCVGGKRRSNELSPTKDQQSFFALETVANASKSSEVSGQKRIKDDKRGSFKMLEVSSGAPSRSKFQPQAALNEASGMASHESFVKGIDHITGTVRLGRQGHATELELNYSTTSTAHSCVPLTPCAAAELTPLAFQLRTQKLRATGQPHHGGP